MIQSGKYMNYIIETLNIIRYEVISRNKLNLTDDNIILENFIRDIMNLTYNYQLRNSNQVNKNYPSVDLIDENNKISVQITSTKSSKKVNDTLDSFNELKLYQKYDTVKIFILTQKQKKYSINNYDKIKFDINTDIMDFDDLYKDILYTSAITRKEICEIIAQEISKVMKSLGKDYFEQYDFKRILVNFTEADWLQEQDGYYLKIKHLFGYLPSHIDVLVDGSGVTVENHRTENEVNLTATIPFECTVIIS